MRGTLPGLITPYPIGRYLPAVYQEDSFAQRFTAGLDDVLASAVAVIDSLEAYVDPDLTPTDFLPWLAGWLGMEADEDLPEELRRSRLREAVGLFAARGTLAGLQAELAMFVDADVRVDDSGGVFYSDTARDCPPGPAQARITVTLPPWAAPRLQAAKTLVAASKPAHVTYSVEVFNDDHLP
ncbi:phage tail protein [Streptomyces wuyuanensis]|uniref:phage tail protein n=1 Tax=Streptomyces wuyuanensis TaxID=1196353 RepID=UPI003422AA3F